MTLQFLGTIEFSKPFQPRKIRHVLMDWDGTTSFTRRGWAEIMTALFFENLPGIAGESATAKHIHARTELMALNGKPSIHQMARLAELVHERGGPAMSANAYHAEFQRRLSEQTHARLESVQQNPSGTDSLLVRGARHFLERLASRGILVTLATGTVLHDVRREMEILCVAHLFQAVHGPEHLDDRNFSKRAVIAAVLREHAIHGDSLLSFGDGQVEISETKGVGGTAIGVASDEEHPGSGKMDADKRTALFAAGADGVIADFQDAEMIVEALILP